MNSETNSTPSVAMIGTEGAGKTVLTAVLAKRLGNPESGMFFNPQGPRTLKHVEKVWNILQGGDWPEGNPAGELFELQWKLEIDGYYVSDVRFIEAPGNEFRSLFEGEQYDKPSTPELRSLAEYCGQSEIVIFLVNLADFIGKKGWDSKASNESAIKAAMDTLSQSGRIRRFCIVITQADLYEGEAELLGDWNAVLKAYLGNVYGAYVQGGKARVFPVSAVCDTIVRDDGGGRMVRVPKAGFSSNGLGDFIDWLRANTQEVVREIREQPLEQPFHAAPVAVQPSVAETVAPIGMGPSSVLAPFATIILCLFALPRFCTRTVSDSVPGVPTIWETMLGLTPAPIITHHEVANWTVIIILTVVFAAVAFMIARANDGDSS